MEEVRFARTSKIIADIRSLRLYLLSRIEPLTTEQLNSTPQGFPNNIIWNLGHMNAVLQMICYTRSGLPIVIDEKYHTKFLTGTRPEEFLGREEIDIIRNSFVGTVDRLLSDYEERRFVKYTPSAKIEEVYGLSVTNIDDAIAYLLYHEGLHQGHIFNLMRSVSPGKP